MRIRFSCLVFAAIALLVLAFAGTAAAKSASTGGRTQRAVAFSSAEVAPPSTCPGQVATNLSAEEQAGVMLCMTNYARGINGLAPLSLSRPLGRAAEQKSTDILACDEFSHEACGREFTYWIERFGYAKGCWSAAENIGYGTGSLGSVRAVFSAWMNSPGHRANILGEFREIGIGRRVGSLEGASGAMVWTQDFGSHGC
jgi:uncharacterized protein YkwD